MDELPYLFRLGARLASGVNALNLPQIQTHMDFVLKFQEPDGGFRGRQGDSDLYYTSFAVRTLSMLDGLSDEVCSKVAAFLQSNQSGLTTVVDLVSWLYTALVVQMASGVELVETEDDSWTQTLAAELEAFRVADGGYAKTLEGAAGSTYTSFLIALCYELIGRPIPNPNRLIQFLYDRQRDDGGFVEILPMKRSGANPTAAACALLQMLGAMDDELRQDVAEFLRSVRSDEGGFQANTRIPIADTLSTFTGLLTVQDQRLAGVIDPSAVRNFIKSLELPNGGFRAAAWDEDSDVEYTFYALGTLALLAAESDS